MEVKLAVDEQRKICQEKFQKLKDRFLSQEQGAKVYLKELSE
ncbi:MAG: hypothetical protein MRECE_18c003 [Mycoplasmataceae bacterium CE_OT135]|nr:MAG: hypothetical protein MRECE_29c003 [Mycoplasmataceae bacterium CE_OT135]KLL03359.1 MAG: hypothetical protein MRECE_18c003 [Mycoplasmataceae bacterium CE_OT135]